MQQFLKLPFVSDIKNVYWNASTHFMSLLGVSDLCNVSSSFILYYFFAFVEIHWSFLNTRKISMSLKVNFFSKILHNTLLSLAAISYEERGSFSSWALFADSLPGPAGFSSTERKLNKAPLTHSLSAVTTGSRPIAKRWEVKGLQKQTTMTSFTLSSS